MTLVNGRPIGVFMIVLGILAAGVVRPVQAQDEQRVRIVLKDGSTLNGTILDETEDTVHFRTVSGVEMTIAIDQVESMVVLRGEVVQGRYRAFDPNYTRLFFAPTGRSLGHGQGYFSLYEIFFPFVSVGVGDITTLAGGVSLIPGTDQLLYGAAKFTFYQKRNVALAAGLFGATLTGERGSGGILMGVGTFGPSRRSMTVGLGFLFGGGEFEETPTILVGGELQASNHIKFITENYIAPNIEDGVVLSGGMRFFGDRLAADFGMVTVLEVLRDTDGFPFIPWIGFAYNFGGGR